MKTEMEIRNKINELLDARMELIMNGVDDEDTCSKIDALLWVIGDRSGKAI